MAQVTGIVKIFIDGQLKRSKPGAKLKVGGPKREAHMGHAYYGTSEELVPSELDCTLVHMADDDAVALSNLRNQTVRFECDTGPVYLIEGMDTAEPCEVQAGGEMPLKMIGPPAVKQ